VVTANFSRLRPLRRLSSTRSILSLEFPPPILSAKLFFREPSTVYMLRLGSPRARNLPRFVFALAAQYVQNRPSYFFFFFGAPAPPPPTRLLFLLPPLFLRLCLYSCALSVPVFLLNVTRLPSPYMWRCGERRRRLGDFFLPTR